MRSSADGNGDGIGDLAGVRARLPYLAELGIDAIWFTPWHPSPMTDAGPAVLVLAASDKLVSVRDAIVAGARLCA